MTWGAELAFRDCPWCGLRDAQMNVHTTELALSPPGKASRFWSVLSCPRCGSVVVLEINPQNEMPPRAKLVVPQDEHRKADVEHLPSDVAKFYADARRVLDAGVPDAAAVQLRRTLEAAAAHFGIGDGPLIGRIERLIDMGLVTKQFGDVLDHVRKLGNLGAHAADEAVDEASAERAFRFTTQVLRNLFEIPAELGATVKVTAPADVVLDAPPGDVPG